MHTNTLNFKSHKQYKNKQSGFTIIEVVLVLAIAGLIFLMVFVALPALQRSQRDAQGRNDVAAVKAALEKYKSNNKGNYPWSDILPTTYGAYISDEKLSPFVNDYLNQDGIFSSPAGTKYRVYGGMQPTGPYVGGAYLPRSKSEITINISSECSGSSIRKLKNFNKGKYTILIMLESGGINNYYCLD